MSRFILRLISVLLSVAVVALTSADGTHAFADDSPADLLPSNPAMWLNSPPLTAEVLKGKGVVLWFYEETCPRCREKWPSMFDLARQFQGQPVVFIAVNSGNPLGDVQQYARDVKLGWPIIADPSRQFEKKWLDTQISLQNIYQCMLILPSGEKAFGRWDDLEGSVKRALNGASWKNDPKTIPAAFLPTWQQVELGNYAAAAPMLKKGLVTKNAEVKDAATRVNAFVQEQISTVSENAAKARQEGESWKAFQLYNAMSTAFAGYDLPAVVAAAQKDLANDTKVKQQREAAKLLDGIKKAFPAARTEAARKRIIGRLEQLASQHEGTDAATEARGLIAQADMP